MTKKISKNFFFTILPTLFFSDCYRKQTNKIPGLIFFCIYISVTYLLGPYYSRTFVDYLLEYVVCMLGVSLFFVYISVSCSSIVQSYTCLQSPVYDGDDVEQARMSRRRRKILKEIFTTEKTYQHNLFLIDKVCKCFNPSR